MKNKAFDNNASRILYKRSCPLSGKGAPAVDYKNLALLRKYITEKGKILPSRVTQVSTKIDLDQIRVQTQEGHNNVIDITDTVKMVFKYPTLLDISRTGNIQSSEGVFNLMNRCIHEIHYGDDVYNRVDISDKDIEEFIDQLTGEQFEKVTQFFQTMPKLSHKVTVTNPKTNVQSEVVLEGLQSFLG